MFSNVSERLRYRLDKKAFWIRRIVYMFCVFLALVFITFYGGNVPYMILDMLIVNCICAVAYIVCIFYSLRINQYIPEHMVDKESPIKMRFSIKNTGHITACSVQMKFMDDMSQTEGSRELSHISLEPMKDLESNLYITCRYSGTYYVGLDKLQIADYFGIFRITFDMPQKIKVVVKPRIIEINSLSFLNSNEEYVDSSKYNTENVVPDNCVREYADGDSLRLIHWRNSSKAGKIMVRTLSSETTREYLVVIDGNISSSSYNEQIIKADMLRESALAIINYLYKCGYNVNCILDDNNTYIIYDWIEFNRVYEAISECTFVKDIDIGELLKKSDMRYKYQTTIIVVSVNEKNVDYNYGHNMFWIKADELAGKW